MKTRLFLFLLLLWTFAGCLAAGGRYSYAMIFVNTGTQDIHDLEIVSSDHQWSFFGPASVLIPFAEKVDRGPIETSPKDKFTLTWKDSTNQSHQEEVDLTRSVASLFSGEIVFTIDGENLLTVEVYPRQGTYRTPPKPHK